MGAVIRGEKDHAILKMCLKTSKVCGRPFVMPMATQTQLAAARKTSGNAGRNPNSLESAAEINVQGPRLSGGASIFGQLNEHTLHVLEAHSSMAAAPGKRCLLAGNDPSAPAGRIRFELNNRKGVEQVRASVHSRTFLVGLDTIAIQALDDSTDWKLGTTSGNVKRRR